MPWRDSRDMAMLSPCQDPSPGRLRRAAHPAEREPLVPFRLPPTVWSHFSVHRPYGHWRGSLGEFRTSEGAPLRVEPTTVQATSSLVVACAFEPFVALHIPALILHTSTLFTRTKEYIDY